MFTQKVSGLFRSLVVAIALALFAGHASAQVINEPPANACGWPQFGTGNAAFYFPDASATNGRATFILVSNSSGRTIPLRVYMLRADNSCVWLDQYQSIGTVPLTIPIHTELSSLGQEVSIKVMPLNSFDMQYLAASKSTYLPPGLHAGTGVKGVETLSNIWHFAEGAFDETLTVLNPSDVPANLQFMFYDEAGNVHQRYAQIPTGPGRIKIDVNREFGISFPHSTKVIAVPTAQTSMGGPVIAVEREITWGNGTEAHSETGQMPNWVWYGAEGSKNALFHSYLLISNPEYYQAEVMIRFEYEGGGVYYLSKTLPGQSRTTVDISQESALPEGSFSYTAVTWGSIVVERAMYWGFKNGTWEGGHVAAGSDVANRWLFAEGNTGGPFHSFLLLYSPGATPMALVFRTEQGEVIRLTTALKEGRHTYNLAEIAPAIRGKRFSLEVITQYNVMAEMSMYWVTEQGMGGNVVQGRATSVCTSIGCSF